MNEATKHAIREVFRRHGVRQVWISEDEEGTDELSLVIDHEDSGDLDLDLVSFPDGMRFSPDLEEVGDEISRIVPHRKVYVWGRTLETWHLWTDVKPF